MTKANSRHFLDALKISDIRFFIGGVAFYTFASRAMLVVIGYQIYQLTHSVLALGILGLVEAIPALTLVLFGGYAADHFDRRKILLIMRAVSALCAALMALLSYQTHGAVVGGLYVMIFLAGVARAFTDPANAALEAQIVPKELTVNASSWITSVWVGCWVLGPACIGIIFDQVGAVFSYSIISLSFLISVVMTMCLTSRPFIFKEKKEPMLRSIHSGLRFVFGHQVLVSALALDLFAVLFGGAIALLPIYAEDILHVGATGLGFLNAAPSAGAMIITLWATHKPPIARAGKNLLWGVAAFGVCMIAFAFSKNFWLSMVALFLSGVFDGVSMVIRRSIIRLLSPDEMRGRVAAANTIFISASNELGAFESGMLAAWIGVVPCVAVGGVVTLGVVLFTAIFAKQLRNLSFDVHTLEQKEK